MNQLLLQLLKNTCFYIKISSTGLEKKKTISTGCFTLSLCRRLHISEKHLPMISKESLSLRTPVSHQNLPIHDDNSAIFLQKPIVPYLSKQLIQLYEDFIIILYRKGTRVAGIETINVDPAYRKQGVGLRLLNAAEEDHTKKRDDIKSDWKFQQPTMQQSCCTKTRDSKKSLF